MSNVGFLDSVASGISPGVARSRPAVDSRFSAKRRDTSPVARVFCSTMEYRPQAAGRLVQPPRILRTASVTDLLRAVNFLTFRRKRGIERSRGAVRHGFLRVRAPIAAWGTCICAQNPDGALQYYLRSCCRSLLSRARARLRSASRLALKAAHGFRDHGYSTPGAIDWGRIGI